MLNRRLIRIRAMQALFAYKQAEGANFQLALDLIADHFSPDLNSMEYQDKEKLEGLKKLGQNLLQEAFSRREAEKFDAPAEVLRTVEQAKEFYLLKNKKDVQHYASRMLIEAERVYELYLQILLLFIDIADRSIQDGNGSDAKSKFSDNQIVKALRAEKVLETQAIRRSVSLSNEQVFVAKLYREAIRSNERFKEYVSKINHTLEEDFAILKYLLKNVILKHEIAWEFFEKQDLYWIDDIETLRAAVTHTFQSFVEEGKLKIALLDEEWEERKEFLQTLYQKSILETKDLEEILIPKLKNWEIERISGTDQILLKMAVVEMLNYPSIPVKVTINEIIEIAKEYSTPKSGQFVNGILDGVAKELKDSGKLRKSGRGMLDNK
ncbi:NusB antitermination factor [Emticicia oligotrophica DSM 17448]|uniref:Transcription antitermination protein NusB n=1 Tax=Emticicia oligotrophica (strain DSM 17448 / CIP 109782 / MTCC 6937 / GPTSA100-15) TaxID=929562 RepID=A0ABN4AII5_EMTOG|nr:transcription antitermination factor NusB [Emticicia oligotrophica]AFK01903.1 NusB antitermination factor [Emticicia oligotrophica DSM 17448]